MEGLWSKAEPQEPDITDWKELDEHAQRMEAAAPCQFIQSCKAQAQANPGNLQHDLPFLELLP